MTPGEHRTVRKVIHMAECQRCDGQGDRNMPSLCWKGHRDRHAEGLHGAMSALLQKGRNCLSEMRWQWRKVIYPAP